MFNLINIYKIETRIEKPTDIELLSKMSVG